MTLPAAQTPLYNHPLHALEAWLVACGCHQDPDCAHCWSIKHPDYEATIYLEETALRAEYHRKDQTRTLTFPYSLSRWDVEQAVFHLNSQES